VTASHGLSLQDRLAAQRAIEAVYWDRREWPSQNPGSKPGLDQVLPASALHDKAERAPA
jgi:hypothetical protein